MTVTDDADAAAKRLAVRRRRWRVWSLPVAILCPLVIAVLQLAAPHLDTAIVNAVCLVLVVVFVVNGVGWFCCATTYPPPIRKAVCIACCLLVIGAGATMRVSGVSGGLIPTLRFFWQSDPDELLVKLSGKTASVDLTKTTEQDFPGFLGGDRSAHVDQVRLAQSWTKTAPREVWRRPIGAGWSGFAAVNGFAVTLEQRGEEEIVSCYEVETGEPRWATGLPTRHHTLFGGTGPLSTPTIHNGRVYALGATGMLRCLAGEDGKTLWQMNILSLVGLDRDADAKQVAWGRSGSPLVARDLVIVPAGGSDAEPISLVAFHADSGRLAWKSGEDQISYASPALVTLGGRQQVVIVNETSVSGHAISTGDVLWTHRWPGSSTNSANVSQAVAVSGSRLLLSKAYGGGAELIRVEATKDGRLRARSLWRNRRLLKTKFTNVCIVGSHAYALSDGILECVQVDSGTRVWKRGRYRHGQILGVGESILVQAEFGDVVLVDASPKTFGERGRIAALSGRTWNTLCLYGRFLLVRNAQEAACFELPVARQRPRFGNAAGQPGGCGPLKIRTRPLFSGA